MASRMLDRIPKSHDTLDCLQHLFKKFCLVVFRPEGRFGEIDERLFTFLRFLGRIVLARFLKCRPVEKIERFQRVPDKVFRFIEKIPALLLEAHNGWNRNYRAWRPAPAALHFLNKLALIPHRDFPATQQRFHERVHVNDLDLIGGFFREIARIENCKGLHR